MHSENFPNRVFNEKTNPGINKYNVKKKERRTVYVMYVPLYLISFNLILIFSCCCSTLNGFRVELSVISRIIGNRNRQ